MDAGLVRPSSVLPTAAGFMTISGRTIRDTKKLGPLSVSEILEKSSNVGTAQIALRLPAQTLYERYRLSGFGSPVPIQLPGTISGRLRPWQSWVAIDQATMSYGHGISVSLLQLARAYTIFARDGDLAPLSITPVDGPVVGDPVFSSQTTAQMRQMLERATGPEGTAPRSRVQGFRVAGKTGTAHKPERGGYAKNRYISSFAGFVPADAPRVVIAVMVDEPTAGGYFGGEVAAPIFAEIAAESLRRMQMSPDPSIRILPDLLRVAEGAR
jgi:cell division protein FtsI (penicillin-binding protein 3)